MFKKAVIFIIATMICAATFAVEATVVSIKGRVEMRDGNTWIALQPSDKVEKGAVISTGYNSQAVLEFKGTKLTLAALTRATVEDLLEESDKDSASLFIDSGKVSANVNGADGKRVGFKVRSPIATASVRGTSFDFSATGELNVDRGLVSLAPSNYEGEKGVPVAAEQNSKIDGVTGAPTDPATEKALSSVGGLNSTTTLTASESISLSASSVSTNSAAANLFNGASSNGATSANVTLDFDGPAAGNLNVFFDYER